MPIPILCRVRCTNTACHVPGASTCTATTRAYTDLQRGARSTFTCTCAR